MDMIGKVRRMHRRDNKSVREIARLTGLSRNTVAKWLEAPLEGQPQYRRGPQPSKLTAFHEALKQALKAGRKPPSAIFITRASQSVLLTRGSLVLAPTES